MSLKEILCGDSLYILKNYIQDNVVDIIITSPPYNVGHNYVNYDDNLDFTLYLKNMKDIFTQCYRVLKDDGRICINIPFAVKNKETKQVRFLSVYITQILNEIGFREFELISWHKGKDIKHFQGNNTAWGSWKSPSCPSFRPLGESILVFYKNIREHRGNAEYIDISSDEFKEWTKNLWYFDKDKGQGFDGILCASNNAKKDLHPAPYPEELVERLLKMYSYKNDVVLDPFNGTGTTTVVSDRLNRQFIGIEISQEYAKLALDRLQHNANNTNLFIKTFPNNISSFVNNDDSINSLNEVFPYKESFSPNLLQYLVDKFDCKIDSVYDPFCGVGSSFLNKNIKKCYGFDISPFAINVAKAKLEKIEPKMLQEAKYILQNFSNNNIKSYPFPKWQSFGKYAKQDSYNIIMSLIDLFQKLDSKVYNFMKYMYLSNIQNLLDFKKDGNGIKYRKSKIDNAEKYLKELGYKAIDLKLEFDSSNNKMLFLENKSSVFNKPTNIQVDCVLTSPPYANLFDYFEIYKMELWSSGIIKNYDDWKSLKKSALRNNKNANLKANDYIDNSLLNEAINELKIKDLESSTLTMLKNYFFDMKQVLQHCFDILKEQGFCFIVVGNSCYKGIPIPTDEILSMEAQKIGFSCKEIIVARKLKTSSQQMAILDSNSKYMLRESIIVLKKEKIK